VSICPSFNPFLIFRPLCYRYVDPNTCPLCTPVNEGSKHKPARRLHWQGPRIPLIPRPRQKQQNSKLTSGAAARSASLLCAGDDRVFVGFSSTFVVLVNPCHPFYLGGSFSAQLAFAARYSSTHTVADLSFAQPHHCARLLLLLLPCHCFSLPCRLLLTSITGICFSTSLLRLRLRAPLPQPLRRCQLLPLFRRILALLHRRRLPVSPINLLFRLVSRLLARGGRGTQDLFLALWWQHGEHLWRFYWHYGFLQVLHEVWRLWYSSTLSQVRN
jgi:hypothetical protein